MAPLPSDAELQTPANEGRQTRPGGNKHRKMRMCTYRILPLLLHAIHSCIRRRCEDGVGVNMLSSVLVVKQREINRCQETKTALSWHELETKWVESELSLERQGENQTCWTQMGVGTPPMVNLAARVIVIISLHYTVKQSCRSCVWAQTEEPATVHATRGSFSSERKESASPLCRGHLLGFGGNFNHFVWLCFRIGPFSLCICFLHPAFRISNGLKENFMFYFQGSFPLLEGLFIRAVFRCGCWMCMFNGRSVVVQRASRMKTYRIINHRRKTSPMEHDGLLGTSALLLLCGCKYQYHLKMYTYITPGSVNTTWECIYINYHSLFFGEII